MKFIFVIAVVLVGFGLLIFLSPSATKKQATQQTALTFSKIQSDVSNGAMLVDVRTPAEYVGGHIDGATNFSLQDIEQGSVPTVDKSKTIYLYCHSGNRSTQAYNILKAAGYSHLVNLGAITHVESIGGKVVK